jgi:hypothetical protein
MSTKLPINLTDLLRQRIVCYLANDFENLLGGDVVICLVE